MKWLKLKNDPEANITPEQFSQGVAKGFIEEIQLTVSKEGTVVAGSKNSLNKNLKSFLKKNKYVIWAKFKNLQGLNKIATRKYEILCGGFLYYHDVHFKKYPKGEGISLDSNNKPFLKKWPTKKFEHKIFFEWLPKGKDKKTSVIIYINATPAVYNPNPPRPPGPPPPES